MPGCGALRSHRRWSCQGPPSRGSLYLRDAKTQGASGGGVRRSSWICAIQRAPSWASAAEIIAQGWALLTAACGAYARRDGGDDATGDCLPHELLCRLGDPRT